jgi:alpha-tubulin suppressor-like RCC1 family protein
MLAVADMPPQALPKSLTIPMNSDYIIPLSGSDPENDALTFRIATVPPGGALYQLSEGTRGAPITSSGTPVLDPAGRVVFAPVPGTEGRPYTTFSFTAFDGQLESSPANINLDVIGFPYATTEPATGLTGTEAVLNAMITPHNQPTVAWFEWGLSSSYGNRTPVISAGSAPGVKFVSTSVSGLDPLRIYHYRVVASNASRVVYGSEKLLGSARRAWSQIPTPAGSSNIISAAAGRSHSLLLRSDRTLIRWGDNTYGQLNLPTVITGAIAVAAGSQNSLVLKDNGTVLASGLPGSVPPGLPPSIAIACGGSHNLALSRDGHVSAWGDNRFGQASVPSGLSNVVAISAGENHSLALLDDGSIAGWGLGTNYVQFTTNYGQATAPVEIGKAVAIFAAQDNSQAIQTNGVLVEWGARGYPLVAIASNVIQSALGDYAYNFALRNDATVRFISLSYPITFPVNISNVFAMAGGPNHAFLLGQNLAPFALSQTNLAFANLDFVVTLPTDDPEQEPLSYRILTLPAIGTLYQYNNGQRGAAIQSPNTDLLDPQGRLIFAPAPDTLGPNYAQFQFKVSDGQFESTPATIFFNLRGKPFAATEPDPYFTPTNVLLNAMITPNGGNTEAWFEWGLTSSFGKKTPRMSVGDGTNVVFFQALLTSLSTGVIYHYRAVASNRVGIVFGRERLLTTGGGVWGMHEYAAAMPPDVTNAVAVSSGEHHGLILTRDGRVSAFTSYLQSMSNVPPGLSNVVGISCGPTNNTLLQADGTLVSWGYEEPLVRTNLGNVVSVYSIRGYHFGLKQDGTVVRWSVPVNWRQPEPTQVWDNYLGLHSIVSLGGGVALRNDGTVASFDDYDNTWNQARVSNVVQVAFWSSGSGMFLKQDGRVEMRSDGSYPPPNAPPFGLSNIVSIGLGQSGQALTSDGQLLEWPFSEGSYTPPTNYLSNVVSFSVASRAGLALTVLPAPQVSDFTLGAVTNATNNDVLLYLPAPNQSKPQLPLRILGTFGGYPYQFTNGAKGSLIYPSYYSPPLVTDPAGRIFWEQVPWASSGITYFSYGLSAGSYMSRLGTFTVIFTNALFSEIESIRWEPNGSVLITAHGVINGNYTVQGGSNFDGWLNLGTATAGSNGTYFFRESPTPSSPRFYRLRSP